MCELLFCKSTYNIKLFHAKHYDDRNGNQNTVRHLCSNNEVKNPVDRIKCGGTPLVSCLDLLQDMDAEIENPVVTAYIVSLRHRSFW